MKLFIASLILSLVTPTLSDHNADFGWSTLSVRMPKPLSDHSASFDPKGGLVYIAGGCDSPDGNVFIDLGDDSFFACSSISDSFYAFDPEDETFETLAKLPRERYRHSSTIVNDQVWIVGGRTLEDLLIPEVDVFDISSGTWTSYELNMEYVVSDHASFAGSQGKVFIVGGYDQNYTAFSQVSVIDAVASSAEDALIVSKATPLATARGDIFGVTSQDGLSAFVAGGFTHENGFCAPLENAEEYSFVENQWTPLPQLLNERGEVVLAMLDNHIFSMGGERQIEGACEIKGETDPGELTEGTELVEQLNRDGFSWDIVASFPNHRFRFAAVAVPEKDLIYAFGGQTNYDNACGCFKTTDDVAIFGEGISGGSRMSMVLSSAIGLIALAAIML